MKTLILEYDDFHYKYPENCLNFLEKIFYQFPTLKISLFTTPLHSYLPISENKDWCKRVRKLIDSNQIKLAVHGTFHNQEEFKYLSENQAINLLLESERQFKKSELPFVKVFRGPHWGINQDTYNALKKLGYTHVYTHENYSDLVSRNKNIKNIIYNWNLKEDAPINSEIIVAHGHTFDTCSNGIQETFNRVENFIFQNNILYKTVDEA